MLRKDFTLHKIKTLLSGCLVVTKLTGWIHDYCSDLLYRLKRLLNYLVNPSGNLSGAVARYRQSAS
jgi:hypothetical protein